MTRAPRQLAFCATLGVDSGDGASESVAGAGSEAGGFAIDFFGAVSAMAAKSLAVGLRVHLAPGGDASGLSAQCLYGMGDKWGSADKVEPD